MKRAARTSRPTKKVRRPLVDEADSSLAAKAARIRKQLDELYPEPPIPLAHSDPFTLLVAVILSAQTTDKKVNQVTPKLLQEIGHI